MSSGLSHQKIKKISHHHAEESLDGPRDERRAELKEKEVDKPVKRSGVTLFHISPLSGLLERGRASETPDDVF
jgi:hypothetical protein